ncbi:hypothetical protein D3C77_311340 [compost metagenome]
MATGMHHRLAGVAEPGCDLAALIGQAGGLFDRQGIHVGAVHHHRPRAVAQDTHHAGGTYCRLHFKTLRLQGLGHQRGGFLLLEGQLRVAVQLFEQLDHLPFILFYQGVDAGVQVGWRSVYREGTETGKGKNARAKRQRHGVNPCTDNYCSEGAVLHGQSSLCIYAWCVQCKNNQGLMQ